jgi:hypothetical protein
MASLSDPRAASALTPNGPVPAGVHYPADYVLFRDLPPVQHDSGGSRHCYARGQNFVVAYADCAGQLTLERADGV